MFDKKITGNKDKRNFDQLQKDKLGKYIYALRDPRDQKIFYVGQGENDRVFSHFGEAEEALKKGKPTSSKNIRILDIWKNEEDVDWFIITYGINDKMANIVESSVYGALSHSQNGIPWNDIKPPESRTMLQEEIELFSAQPVNPTLEMQNIFIFPIQNQLAKGINTYDATKQSWYVKKNFQKNTYAVGLLDYISVGSFKIEDWYNIGDKHGFNGIPDNQLLNKSWKNIISKTIGYWQRGNYIIVDFDGNGNFIFKRGAGDLNGQSFPCTIP